MPQAKYVQLGEALDYRPPAALRAGDVVVVGIRPMVAKQDVAAGKLGALANTGAYDVAKVGSPFSQGAPVYWNGTATPVGSGEPGAAVPTAADSIYMGYAVVAADANAPTVRVLLNPAGGTVGEQGPQGETGPQGESGPAGPQGIQGVPGPQGLQGNPGVQGPTGAQGLPGEPGPQGPAGAQGVQGLPGPAGETGPPGATGEPGPAFIASGEWNGGTSYPQYAAVTYGGSSYWATTSIGAGLDPAGGNGWQLIAQRGSDGAAGATGPQGEAGAMGDPGPQGEPGSPGETGPPGAAGEPGPSFAPYGEWNSWTSYPQYAAVAYEGSSYWATTYAGAGNVPTSGGPWQLIAAKGVNGTDGAQGPPGDPGGPPGPQGEPGATGEPGPALQPYGDWNGWTYYPQYAAVTHNGSSYWATTYIGAGTDPANGSPWQLLAAKGEPGMPGPEGPSGIPTPPTSGTWMLKVIENVVQWVEEV